MRPTTSIHATEEPTAEMLSAPVRGLNFRSILAVLGGLMLTMLMGLTVVDVIGRYLFNSPLTGAAELTELLLAAIIFLGLPAVSLANDHVTVDLVTDMLPSRLQVWRLALTGIFSALVLAVVAWRIWIYADQIGGYGGSTNSLRIPIAPLGYFCAICTAAGALLSVAVPVLGLVRRLKNRI